MLPFIYFLTMIVWYDTASEVKNKKKRGECNGTSREDFPYESVGILPRARGAVGRDQRLRGAAREMKHGSRQLGGKVVVHVSRRNANFLFFPAKNVEAELAVVFAIVVERDEERDP
jgi:hypothetical protein